MRAYPTRYACSASAASGVYAPSGNVHTCRPVRASRTYVRRARVANHTLPAITVGAPEIGPLARNRHRTSPVAASSANELLRVRAGEHGALPDGRRGVDVAPGRVRPAQLAAGGAERVDLAVGGADVHAPVCQRRGRVEPTTPAEAILRGRAPLERTRPQVESVEAAVVGADERAVPRGGDRPLDPAAGVERPELATRPQVERDDVTAPVADEHPLPDDEGRRLGRPEPEAPAHVAGLGVERDHLALERLRRALRVAGWRIQEGLHDEVVCDGRGRGDAPSLGVAPDGLPGLRVHGERDPVVVRDVQAPVGDRRRELEERAPTEPPHPRERRAMVEGRDPDALVRVPEGWPGDDLRAVRPGGRRRRGDGLGDLGLDELLRRRPGDVGGSVELRDERPQAYPTDDNNGRADDCDRPAPHVGSMMTGRASAPA